MNKSAILLPKIIGRGLLIGLLLIIIVHLILSIYYTEVDKRAETKVNRDIIIQQVMNVIEQINYTPVTDRARVVNAVDIPNLTLTLSSKPKWKLRFDANASLWRISQAIEQQKNYIRVSLQYGTNNWLNISTPFVSVNRWMQILLSILEIVVVSSIIISIWSINQFATPLRNFKKAAERLAEDVNAPPLPEDGPAIVRDVAYAMNQLQQRIQELLRQRTHMLAALSHDLRTPITRMKLRAQFIEDKELYEKNITDLDQMEEMIADTLAFAKNDSLQEKENKLDLSALVYSIVNDFVDMGYPIEIKAMPQTRVVVKGRATNLRRALNNIIDNAIKYGKKALIEFTVENNMAVIRISDEGTGIPEEQLKKVFEPFYRGDHSRSRETGGTGLGLAVARDVIRSHHGQVQLRNLDTDGNTGGLEVSVILPKI